MNMNTNEAQDRYTKYLTKKETRMSDSTIFKIFISYSTNDSEKIKPMLDQLITIQGVKIFFAERSIMPGSEISQTIIKNINDSDIFIVFFSEFAKESSYVQQEIGVAKSINRIIIPILLDSTKPTGMLEGKKYLKFYDALEQKKEMKILCDFLVQAIESKRQKQNLWKLIGFFGLGYLLSRSDVDIQT